MEIVTLIDSFKGSATSKELNEAFFAKISAQTVQKKMISIADGGEGTLESVFESIGGEYHFVEIQDPMGGPLTSRFLLTEYEGRQTALIESADVLGIHLMSVSENTFRSGSSYGLGMLLSKVIDLGIKNIIVSLGGSGTSDGGLGCLAALGVKMSFHSGMNPLFIADRIDMDGLDSRLLDTRITVLADVTNVYFGDAGFSHVFGPQKGGTTESIDIADSKAKYLAQLIKQTYGVDLNKIAGSGAAGGLGGAFALIGAKIVKGFDTISELIDLEQQLAEADLVVTGEGRIDGQTTQGKVPAGVLSICKRLNIPVVMVCGGRTADIGYLENEVLGVFSIQSGPTTLEKAMNKEVTLENMSMIGKSVIQLFRHQIL